MSTTDHSTYKNFNIVVLILFSQFKNTNTNYIFLICHTLADAHKSVSDAKFSNCNTVFIF